MITSEWIIENIIRFNGDNDIVNLHIIMVYLLIQSKKPIKMISYKLRKSHPQISEMWVKVAARLALAGDAFSLADAVEGAWLSGEAASGFTSVSSSMIGRKVIEKISNWSLFWGYYSMVLLYLNMFGI